MLWKGTLAESASGSIGGVTASRNRGGAYFRGRAIPTNPNTPQQQAIRSAMSQLASLWASTLTQVQREGWDTYALNVLLPNALGDMINIGGVGMFMRSNISRISSGVAGLTRVDDAPTIFDLGDVGPQAVGAAIAAANTISMEWNDDDAWADEDASALLIYTSRPHNQGINYFKGPYRFAAAVEGDSTTPPTSPEVVDAAFPFAVDQRVFVFTRVTRADGRLSSPFRGTGVGA